MSQIRPVLLSGGSGTRLWPLSRALFPKQLQALLPGTPWSLLQETGRRVSDRARFGKAIIVSNDEHRFAVAAQLEEAGLAFDAPILEPVGRNTAPAITVAALVARENGEDPLLLVLPSDHHVGNVGAFHEAIRRGKHAAEAGELVMFGMQPTHPETGYGYIKAGDALTEHFGVHRVARFVEKPTQDKAEALLAEGGHYWNSGIFLFRASVLLAEMERLQPAMLAACKQSLARAQVSPDFIRLDAATFRDCPSDSIDYAVLEKTSHATVVPAEFAWSDIGSWAALWALSDKDDHGNVSIGDVMTDDTQGCFIRSEDRLVTTLGVRDLVIVETGDAVLVAGKDKVQDIKKIVETLKAGRRREHLSHLRTDRPWGSFVTIESGPGYLVKRLTVKPGAALSLQMHNHRAEHWVVAEGTAEVTVDGQVTTLRDHQSVDIPRGAKHRLRNPGKATLQVIEVQTGPYLSEDDIVRFEDAYRRPVEGHP